MSEHEQEQATEQEAPKTYTAEEVEEMTKGLKAKVDELLGEKKTVSQRAKELEEAQAQAEQERLKEKEEFKTLWEREQEAKRELQEKYETFSKQVQQRDIDLESTRMASELTRDTHRADLLKEQINKFARFTEEGVKFEMGGVEVDRAKIVEHLTTNYPFLVDGSQASGGGANGSKGGGAAKTGKVDGDKRERAAYFAQKFDLK